MNTWKRRGLSSNLVIFGSVRSSRKANVRSYVRPVQVCLEQSNFIFLAQVSLTVRELELRSKL